MKTIIKIPSTLSIALALTILVWFVALLFTKPISVSSITYTGILLTNWYNGIWELLSFTMQMVMILVLGHMIALSPIVTRFIFWIIARFKNIHSATIAVLVATLLVAYINWGLGLIFGAVMARKLGEYAVAQRKTINYPLVCAAAYSGLMVWHGGLSGSAPLTVASKGHFLEDKIGILSTSETIFSFQNISINLGVMLALIALVFLLLKKSPSL